MDAPQAPPEGGLHTERRGALRLIGINRPAKYNGFTLRMAERAGVGNAMLYLLTGDEFGSAEALRLNFVQKVVPAGQELGEAIAIAGRIAAQAPLAVLATRRSVLTASERGPAAAVAEFAPVQRRLAQSEDAAEGVRSFVERRPARFSGR